METKETNVKLVLKALKEAGFLVKKNQLREGETIEVTYPRRFNVKVLKVIEEWKKMENVKNETLNLNLRQKLARIRAEFSRSNIK